MANNEVNENQTKVHIANLNIWLRTTSRFPQLVVKLVTATNSPTKGSKARSDTRSVVLQWGKIRHPASRRIFGVKFYVSCVIFVMIFPQISKNSKISRFVLI